MPVALGEHILHLRVIEGPVGISTQCGQTVADSHFHVANGFVSVGLTGEGGAGNQPEDRQGPGDDVTHVWLTIR
ncbi:hypothetical protein ABZ917_41655 [Nonomuraea wenchangensis]